MPHQGTGGNHPLANCSTLLEVNDFVLIGPTKDGADANLNWVAYNASSQSFESVASDTYPSQSDVKLSKFVASSSYGRPQQGVVVVTPTSVKFTTGAGTALSSRDFAAPTGAIRAIVGADPITGYIVFACQDSEGCHLLSLDIGSGKTQKQTVSGVAGTVLQGDIVGALLATYVFLLAGQQGRLQAYALDITAPDKPVASVSLGSLSGQFDVRTVVAHLEDGPYQHLVCTYVDGSGEGMLAAITLDKSSALHVSKTALDTSFAKPTRSQFRLAAGPLWDSQSAVVPVVVGYSGKYGTVSGCACLLLLEYDSDTKQFEQKSRYAVDTEDESSFASNDLHIGAGLFSVSGTAVWGVLVAGIGASMSQLMSGESSARLAMVNLDQNKRVFPPLSACDPIKLATDTVATMKGEQPVIGFQSDLGGKSVRLGLPTFTQRPGKSQVLAVLQAPPYEAKLFGVNTPTLTFTSHKESTENYNINSNKLWIKSKDFGANLSLGGLSLGTNITTMYGHGFDSLKDSISSNSVTVSKTFNGQDHMIVLSVDYDVWAYPSYQGDKLAGQILVVFPTSAEPIQDILACDDPDYGYVQQHEAGTLLSYLDSVKNESIPTGKSERLKALGFSSDTLLFEKEGQEIDPSSPNSNWNFNQSRMVSSALSHIWNVHQSTNDSASFHFSTMLFDFLPLSFGLNIGETDTYSDNEIKTTTLSKTKMIDIQVQYPAYSAQNMGFQVTPIIYQHAKMGCLMVSYQVQLIGSAWKDYAPAQPLKLMATNPAGGAESAAFSRSISFSSAGAQTEIQVEVFNNSLGAIEEVVVDLFAGSQKPVYVADKSAFYRGWQFPFPSESPPSAGKTQPPLATQTIASINPIGRGLAKFTQTLKDGDYVAVFVYGKKWPSFQMGQAAAYWRQYGKS